MPYFICSFINIYLGCFYFLAVMNNAAVNVCEQVFVWIPVFVFLGSVSRSSIVDYMVIHNEELLNFSMMATEKFLILYSF